MADEKLKAMFARVTPEEHARLEAAAKAEGFRSVAEWVRQTLFKRAEEIEKDASR